MKTKDRVRLVGVVVGTWLLGGGGPVQAQVVDGIPGFATISAASFAVGATMAPESIASGFGANLAGETLAAAALPLPTQLGDVRVKVRDVTGTDRIAPLYLVSPGQINYQIPPGTAAGSATVTVVRRDNPTAAGTIEVAGVAPGLFSANATGSGVAAALAFRVTANDTRTYEPVARYDERLKKFVSQEIGLGPESDKVYLILYGTGIRLRSSLSAVTATIGGEVSEVSFAGPAPGYPGVDQVNVLIPRALWWHGEVDIAITVDGKMANVVSVNVF